MSKKDKVVDKTKELEQEVNEAENTAKAGCQEEVEETVNEAETEETETAEQQLEKAKEEIAQLKDNYLRKVAEFENFKKRTLKEKTELILNGGEKTVSAILPVLDDLERAAADNTEDPNAIREGIQLIFHKFVKTLEGIGVKKIETEGADFNVDFHEAVAMVPGMGDENKGKVIDCLLTGYMLNDKVVRHAKVAVGQ